MNSPPPSNDYISETRRALLYAPVEKFPAVPIDLTDQAVSMLEDVSILLPGDPPQRLSVSLRSGTTLSSSACATRPRRPLELRSEGTAVIHVVERPEPVTPAVVVQLAQAMFGESKLGVETWRSRSRASSLSSHPTRRASASPPGSRQGSRSRDPDGPIIARASSVGSSPTIESSSCRSTTTPGTNTAQWAGLGSGLRPGSTSSPGRPPTPPPSASEVASACTSLPLHAGHQ